ncbi:MAG: tripartite tricarboxylate transporter substrate binding protein [Proteobacteria bacterium]|nr:tripartite tricarboxylate transporter substrate binding protein [Burkholderiales bacterium]
MTADARARLRIAAAVAGVAGVAGVAVVLLVGVAYSPALLAQGAGAAAFPSRPLRIIVPFTPGGGLDGQARVLGDRLSSALGQPVNVENRPGAATIVGTEYVVRLPADGHTLLMVTTVIAINPALHARLPYDAERDLTPLMLLSTSPLLLAVHPSVPVKTLPDFVKFARARPGELSYATAGTGTAAHVAMELLQTMTDTRLVHVPYKGIGPAMGDILGGHMSMIITAPFGLMSHIRAGKLRPVAVTTARRTPALPEVPAIGEHVNGYEATAWQGIALRAGTPPEIVARLSGELIRIVKLPDVNERMLADGSAVVGDTPGEFSSFIRSETTKWVKVLRAAGVKPEA